MPKCKSDSEKSIPPPLPDVLCASEGREYSVNGEHRGEEAGGSDLLLDKYKQVSECGEEKQLRRREKRKKGSISIADKLRAFDPYRADRMQKCGELVYRETCKGCGVERHLVVSRCMDRFCPTCGSIRTGKLASRYEKRINEKTEGLCGYHLVLTFRNTGMLPDYSGIVKLVKKLRLHPMWKKYGRIVGGLWSIEVTRSEREWHPHVHMLIFTREPLPVAPDGKWPVWFNQSVSDVWRELTGDSFIIRGTRYDGRAVEMVKYIGKPADLVNMDCEPFSELCDWTKGRRSVQPFGILYGQLPEDETEDVEHENCSCAECGGTVFERVVLRFIPKHGRYLVHDVYDMDYSIPLDERGDLPP